VPVDTALMILRDYGPWALIIALLTFVGWRGLDAYVRRRVDGLVELAVGKELAEHRSGLEEQAARLRQQHLKEHTTFSLYTTRQHRVYPRLFGKFRIAEGTLVRPTIEMVNDYSKASDEQIRKAAVQLGVDQEIVAPILAKLKTDRRAAIRELQALDDQVRKNRGLNAYRDARNYAVLNDLYLSDPVRVALNAAIDKFAAYSAYVIVPEAGTAMAMYKAGEAVGQALTELSRVIRAELSGEVLASATGTTTPAKPIGAGTAVAPMPAASTPTKERLA